MGSGSLMAAVEEACKQAAETAEDWWGAQSARLALKPLADRATPKGPMLAVALPDGSRVTVDPTRVRAAFERLAPLVRRAVAVLAEYDGRRWAIQPNRLPYEERLALFAEGARREGGDTLAELVAHVSRGMLDEETKAVGRQARLADHALAAALGFMLASRSDYSDALEAERKAGGVWETGQPLPRMGCRIVESMIGAVLSRKPADWFLGDQEDIAEGYACVTADEAERRLFAEEGDDLGEVRFLRATEEAALCAQELLEGAAGERDLRIAARLSAGWLSAHLDVGLTVKAGGEGLDRERDLLGLKVEEAAGILGVTPVHWRRLLKGETLLSAELAEKWRHAVGSTSDVWRESILTGRGREITAGESARDRPGGA